MIIPPISGGRTSHTPNTTTTLASPATTCDRPKLTSKAAQPSGSPTPTWTGPAQTPDQLANITQSYDNTAANYVASAPVANPAAGGGNFAQPIAPDQPGYIDPLAAVAIYQANASGPLPAYDAHNNLLGYTTPRANQGAAQPGFAPSPQPVNPPAPAVTPTIIAPDADASHH